MLFRSLVEDHTSSPSSAGTTLLNQIKQRATVDPSTGEVNPNSLSAAPKVRSEVGSSKLRDLLNNLPTTEV